MSMERNATSKEVHLSQVLETTEDNTRIKG